MFRNRSQGSSESGASCAFLAVTLGVAFLLLSFVRIVGDLNSAAGNVAILQSAIEGPVWKTRLAFNTALFFVALLALHVAFGLLGWFMSILSQRAMPRARLSRREWLLIWFLAGMIVLLVGNATRFPHSSLGQPYHEALRGIGLMGIPLHVLLYSALGLAAIGTTISASWRSGTLARFAGILATACVVVAATGFHPLESTSGDSSSQRPNLIILGVDSLRTDAIGVQHTPALHRFMKDAVRFDDAITPLARTFPSWVSILTGRHPHTTGAFMNLLPRAAFDTGATLPQELRKLGYRTTYAIDETRFSNLDASFGFDETIMPGIGGSDFVLSLVADTPLSNAVMNTWLGELLFPHVHANRAAHFTYDPDAYVTRVERHLNSSAPMMLAMHMTLAHYPFTWATSEAATGNDRLARGDYFEALGRVDRQFDDMLRMLERRRFLENAIVVVLSDHGEAIGLDHDVLEQQFPGRNDPDNAFQRWGHGTSVFSPSQYRVVLGMRGFGPAAKLLPPPRHFTEPVSLLDLTPTLMSMLGRPDSGDYDGISLVPLLRGERSVADDQRIRFTETEYNPIGFTAEQASPSAVAAAASVYKLDPVTDRITIRMDRLDWIMANRQFAALLGNRMIGAAVPAGKRAGTYDFVFLDLGGNGVQSDADRLREALRTRFKLRFEPTSPGD